MITEDLITYIQSQRRKNISDTEISSRLAKAGWHDEDIKEGFQRINPPVITPKFTSAPVLDPYRERPEIETQKDVVEKSPPKIESSSSGSVTPSLDFRPTAQAPQIPIISKPEIKLPSKVEPKLDRTPLPMSEPRKEEFIPSLIPKIEKQTQVIAPPRAPIADMVPKNAILSSYPQDVSSVRILNEETIGNTKHSLRKWIFISLAVILVGGTAVAFFTGAISLSSFIKKDPKNSILENQALFEKLTSYKVETTVDVTLPTVANITNGLMSGATVASNDTDYISLHAQGRVQEESPSPILEYIATIKSSLLKDDLTADLIYDGRNSFVTVPDLSGLLGTIAPERTTVSIPRGRLDLILPMLPAATRNVLTHVDLYKILAYGIPKHQENNSKFVFEDFIQSVTVAEKAPEDIHGILTYHYELQADRQATKKFLTALLDQFTVNLSDSEKSKITEALGTATFDALDVWIGKDDNMIHQYKVALTLPLATVLGLEDKGIDGSTVKLGWQSAYYDLNTPNAISLPATVVPFTDFTNTIHDLRIKDLISSLAASAKVLHNALGNYGARANPSGSCTNPNSSSLFSPVGHKKGAATAVGAIADTMTTLLEMTNGAGSCFSTSSAWAMAVPLHYDPTASFCADSTGATKILSTPLNGVVCK